jgi:hypothetical protein
MPITPWRDRRWPGQDADHDGEGVLGVVEDPVTVVYRGQPGGEVGVAGHGEARTADARDERQQRTERREWDHDPHHQPPPQQTDVGTGSLCLRANHAHDRDSEPTLQQGHQRPHNALS